MSKRVISTLLLFAVTSALGQGREPRRLGEGVGVDRGDPDEPVTFKPTLTGVDKLMLSVLDVPKILSSCAKKEDLVAWTSQRFAHETNAPILGKSGDRNLPLLELWLETPSDSPELFRGASIPEGMEGFAVRMKVTTFTSQESAKDEKSKELSFVPATALDGNTIWWGTNAECNGGAQKAVQALLDRFFAEYRTANPGRRLPNK